LDGFRNSRKTKESGFCINGSKIIRNILSNEDEKHKI